MKFLFAVGADFGPARQAVGLWQQGQQGQPRPEAPRPPSPGVVIDALPLEVSEEIRANRNFRSSGRSTRFGRPAVGYEPSTIRQPGGAIALPQGRTPSTRPAHGDTALLVPPGYDAGIGSTLPTLLDVTV